MRTSGHFLTLLGFVIASFFAAGAVAQKKTDDAVPLQFQADKNNIQILPQRFEYNLVDEDHIKIGDIVIDSSSFGFQVSAAPTAEGKYRARFVWPAGLLKTGTLSIKDNTGKSIWSTAVNRQNTRQMAPNVAKSENSLVRNQLTEFITDQLEPSLIEDMKYLPFMNFCINRKTQDTNIYLCSKEVYLTTQKGRLGIFSRSEGKRSPFVEINGKSVSNQGVIFLNDEAENIGFRAMTQSGAVLEVETRMKAVDFKDVVISKDGKTLVLTASGAEPVNEEKVQRVSEDSWRFQVDAQRPVLYLKGQGEIPMRQEFYVKGSVPNETLRPSLEKTSVRRIYRDQMALSGTAASGTTVGPGNADQTVEKTDANHFVWNIGQIPAGQSSRHYLKVSQAGNNYFASYDLYRDYAYEAGAIASYWSPASQLYGSGFIKWWIENFFGSEETWAHLQWGIQAEQGFVLLKKDSEAQLSITHLELLWRANPGFHFVDPTWGLILPYEIIQATGISSSSPGLGAFYSQKAPKSAHLWMHWYDAKLIYLVGGSGLKSVLQASALAYYHADKRLSWNYGLGINQYSFDPGESKMQIQLLGGASYRF